MASACATVPALLFDSAFLEASKDLRSAFNNQDPTDDMDASESRRSEASSDSEMSTSDSEHGEGAAEVEPSPLALKGVHSAVEATLSSHMYSSPAHQQGKPQEALKSALLKVGVSVSSAEEVVATMEEVSKLLLAAPAWGMCRGYSAWKVRLCFSSEIGDAPADMRGATQAGAGPAGGDADKGVDSGKKAAGGLALHESVKLYMNADMAKCANAYAASGKEAGEKVRQVLSGVAKSTAKAHSAIGGSMLDSPLRSVEAAMAPDKLDKNEAKETVRRAIGLYVSAATPSGGECRSSFFAGAKVYEQQVLVADGKVVPDSAKVQGHPEPSVGFMFNPVACTNVMRGKYHATLAALHQADMELHPTTGSQAVVNAYERAASSSRKETCVSSIASHWAGSAPWAASVVQAEMHGVSNDRVALALHIDRACPRQGCRRALLRSRSRRAPRAPQTRPCSSTRVITVRARRCAWRASARGSLTLPPCFPTQARSGSCPPGTSTATWACRCWWATRPRCVRRPRRQAASRPACTRWGSCAAMCPGSQVWCYGAWAPPCRCWTRSG